MSDAGAFWIAGLVCLALGLAWWVCVILLLLGLACAIAESRA